METNEGRRHGYSRYRRTGFLLPEPLMVTVTTSAMSHLPVSRNQEKSILTSVSLYCMLNTINGITGQQNV